MENNKEWRIMVFGYERVSGKAHELQSWEYVRYIIASLLAGLGASSIIVVEIPLSSIPLVGGAMVLGAGVAIYGLLT